MSYTICYISHADKNLNKVEIEELFDEVTKFNNAHNIKGLLLYGLGNFFQILEGEKNLITELFHENITNDTRHKDIFVVIEKEYKEPIFSEYDSKFNTVKNSQDLKKLLSYLSENKYKSTHNKLERLMKPFLVAME